MSSREYFPSLLIPRRIFRFPVEFILFSRIMYSYSAKCLHYIVVFIYYSFDFAILVLQGPTENHMYVKWAPCWKILIIIIIIYILA